RESKTRGSRLALTLRRSLLRRSLLCRSSSSRASHDRGEARSGCARGLQQRECIAEKWRLPPWIGGVIHIIARRGRSTHPIEMPSSTDNRTPAGSARYALHDAIASGGMATVHIGRFFGPAGFSRTVAIK